MGIGRGLSEEHVSAAGRPIVLQMRKLLSHGGVGPCAHRQRESEPGLEPRPAAHGLLSFPSALRVVVCGWSFMWTRGLPDKDPRSHSQVPSRCEFGDHHSAQCRRSQVIAAMALGPTCSRALSPTPQAWLPKLRLGLSPGWRRVFLGVPTPAWA